MLYNVRPVIQLIALTEYMLRETKLQEGIELIEDSIVKRVLEVKTKAELLQT